MASFDDDGEENAPNSFTTVGYSCIVTIIVIIFGTTVIATGILNGFRRYRLGMSFVGNCNAVIGAACHRPNEDVDDVTLPVLWGAVSDQEEGKIGHCCSRVSRLRRLWKANSMRVGITKNV